VRTKRDPLSVIPALRRIGGEVDSQQPLSAIRTMGEMLDVAIADRR
jgi:hypothetical protein